MMNRFLALLIALLLLSFSVSVLAQDQTGPAQVGLRPDAPTYALHGPYWVGTRDFVINADSERPLTFTVWYPALNPDALEESVEYTIPYINFFTMLATPEDRLTAHGHALLNAQPDLSAGPYPLFVQSHGFMAWRQGYTFLSEHLASWGFVVIAPDHPGENPGDGADVLWRNDIDRTRDVTRTLDYAELLTSVNGDLAGVIDTDKVAIGGHSFGAWTGLVAGGARINTPEWKAWCDEVPERYEAESDCQFLDYQDQMAALLGLTETPTGLWPSRSDSRIDAIIDMAGPMWLSGKEGLKSVTVPVLGLVGSVDDAVGAPNSGPVDMYQAISSSQKALVVFKNGNHSIFVGSCESQPDIVAAAVSALCTDPVWDMERAHDLMNHFAVAFLLATLKGDVDAAAALAPDAVSFPGIEYQAQGF